MDVFRPDILCVRDIDLLGGTLNLAQLQLSYLSDGVLGHSLTPIRDALSTKVSK